MSDEYEAILQLIAGFPDRDESVEANRAIENAVQLARAVSADDFFRLLAEQLEAALNAPVQLEEFAWASYTQTLVNRALIRRLSALSGEGFDEIAADFRNSLVADDWFMRHADQEGGAS